MTTPPPPVCMLRGHEGVVTALCFTDEEDAGIHAKPSLISGSDSGEIFVWNLQTQRSYHRFKGHDGKMILYLSYYKSSLVSQGRDGLIHIWSFVKNQWSITSTFQCPNYGFCASTLFPTEQMTFLVAPTGDGSSLAFYDYKTTHLLSSHNHKATGNTTETCMCLKVFLKDSRFLVLLGFDSGDISLWDYASKRETSRLKIHSEVVLCLDFDPKHRGRGISGSVGKHLHIWEIVDNQLVAVHRETLTNPGVNAVKIREDSKIVITVGQDHAIRVFSWKNLRPLAVLQHHSMPVVSLSCYDGALSKYKSVFASGSKDRNILLWSIY